MKAGLFDYERVATVGEAIGLLESSEDAKLLAGGQSLVPMLNLRLARPSCLIDVSRLPLREVHIATDQTLRIGALVTHRVLESQTLIAQEAPLLSKCAGFIGHRAIRQRGTAGGSLAHADPTAELALATVALGATIAAQSRKGLRKIAAEDLFHGAFSTALEHDEMIVHIDVPRLKANEAHGFAEFSRRSGDFAVAAAACVLPTTRTTGLVPRLAVVGASSVPQLIQDPDHVLADRTQSSRVVAQQLVEHIEVEAAAEDVGYRRLVLVAVISDALTDAGWDDQGDEG